MRCLLSRMNACLFMQMCVHTKQTTIHIYLNSLWFVVIPYHVSWMEVILSRTIEKKRAHVFRLHLHKDQNLPSSFYKYSPFRKCWAACPILVFPRWAVSSHATSLALALLWLSPSLASLPLPLTFYGETRQLKDAKRPESRTLIASSVGEVRACAVARMVAFKSAEHLFPFSAAAAARSVILL